MSYSDIRYQRHGHIALVTMNRPRYRNAQSRRLIRELDHALGAASLDDEVRVIVLRGSGTSFSSGHDLGTPEERAESERNPIPEGVGDRSAWSWTTYAELPLRWRDLPKPTIAQVQGHCIFAGWTLASAMDFVIASDDATFVPHLSEYFTLPWVVGARRAKEILFRGRSIRAEEALELGMVIEVVPPDELDARTIEIAEQIAGVDPFMLRMIKAAVNAFEDGAGFQGAIRGAHSHHMLTYFGGAGRAQASDDAGPARMTAVERALRPDAQARRQVEEPNS